MERAHSRKWKFAAPLHHNKIQRVANAKCSGIPYPFAAHAHCAECEQQKLSPEIMAINLETLFRLLKITVVHMMAVVIVATAVRTIPATIFQQIRLAFHISLAVALFVSGAK